MSRRAVVCLLALLGAGLAPGSAAATDGNLYGFGASAWAVSPPFTTTVPAPQVWLVQAPALSLVATGNWWEMNWGCPVAGSEIAAVQWSALRTQPASSLALQVTGDRRPIWAEGDSAIPQSPAAGRAYDVRLPGGNCNVHLALTQMEARSQHARGYFIDNPRVLVRDVASPAVSLSAAPGGWVSASSAPAISWVVTDNFGADGVGGQSVLVDGQARWSGSPGTGSHRLDLPLAGLADGLHTLEVRVDGDGTAGASAQASIAVDGTPPRVHGFGARVPAVPGGADLTWSVDDDLSGVAESRVEMNAAPDGTPAGDWIPVGAVAGGGEKALGLRAVPVPDGLHAWRVTATDGAGNPRVQTAPAPIVVDTTAPRLELNEVPAGWVNRAAIDLTVSDDLEAAMGPGRVEIDVNSAPDGDESGQWLRRGALADVAGRRVVPLDLTGLENGPHAVRVVARNGGPLAGALAREKRATVRVDLTDPLLSSATFSPRGPRLTVAWVATDAHSGVSIARVQWRDGLAWRTLSNEHAADGAGNVVVDTSTMPTGERTLRLVIGDAAGNEATRAAVVPVSGHGRGAAAGLVARLRSARLSLSVDRARLGRRDGRLVLVHRTATGRSVTVRGRLLDGRARPIVGVEVQARDERGLLIGSGRTRHGGAFEMVARPVGGGLVRVGVGVGADLLPRNAGVELVLEVRPRIEVGVSTTSARVGEKVIFTGRLRPSPAELGLGGRKGVVLEWRDPLRHTWRPVVNARMRADGTFSIPWAFGLGGLTIPTRVVVPTEVGWPLLPARSRVVRVRVG